MHEGQKLRVAMVTKVGGAIGTEASSLCGEREEVRWPRGGTTQYLLRVSNISNRSHVLCICVIQLRFIGGKTGGKSKRALA